MSEGRLFVGAPEAMHVQATYVHGQGWHLSLGVRLAGERWDEAYRVTYTHLTTPELADVIGEETSRQLRVL